MCKTWGRIRMRIGIVLMPIRINMEILIRSDRQRHNTGTGTYLVLPTNGTGTSTYPVTELFVTIPDFVIGRTFYILSISVADPDPYVFGPPGSVSQRYGSGSGSFYHQAKTLISTLL
jgi:hypothetical protein